MRQGRSPFPIAKPSIPMPISAILTGMEQRLRHYQGRETAFIEGSRSRVPCAHDEGVIAFSSSGKKIATVLCSFSTRDLPSAQKKARESGAKLYFCINTCANPAEIAVINRHYKLPSQVSRICVVRPAKEFPDFGISPDATQEYLLDKPQTAPKMPSPNRERRHYRADTHYQNKLIHYERDAFMGKIIFKGSGETIAKVVHRFAVQDLESAEKTARMGGYRLYFPLSQFAQRDDHAAVCRRFGLPDTVTEIFLVAPVQKYPDFGCEPRIIGGRA